ncbi:hypothetical protein AB0K48_60835, partial [Nonomuraea sp. NPDC055795]
MRSWSCPTARARRSSTPRVTRSTCSTWTVKATNEGPNPASSVVVTTTLPAEVAFL